MHLSGEHMHFCCLFRFQPYSVRDSVFERIATVISYKSYALYCHVSLPAANFYLVDYFPRILGNTKISTLIAIVSQFLALFEVKNAY